MKRVLMILFLCCMVLPVAPAGSAEKRVSVPLGNSPSLGPETAPVTIVEFIDFQ